MIGYHDTEPDNIEGILRHGMDPSRRKVFTDGYSLLCDWYGTHMNERNVRHKGGNTNIVVFVLLVDPRLGTSSGFTDHRPTNRRVITGTKGEHAIPLGVISLAA
jgi:hypothetical protein